MSITLSSDIKFKILLNNYSLKTKINIKTLFFQWKSEEFYNFKTFVLSSGNTELKIPLLVSHEYLDHIIKLGKEEKLRMSYSIPTPGYTGFIPKAPFNIKPEKKFKSPNDGQLSLNTAIER